MSWESVRTGGDGGLGGIGAGAGGRVIGVSARDGEAGGGEVAGGGDAGWGEAGASGGETVGAGTHGLCGGCGGGATGLITGATFGAGGGETVGVTAGGGVVRDAGGRVAETACSSSVRNNSLDASSMLLPNGSYSINANDCIRLSCEASQLRPTTWPTCPPTRCPGGESLFLGNTTSTSYANRRATINLLNAIGLGLINHAKQVIETCPISFLNLIKLPEIVLLPVNKILSFYKSEPCRRRKS
ncbi:hypothetical protein Bca101_037157 [Brassica carinata]